MYTKPLYKAQLKITKIKMNLNALRQVADVIKAAPKLPSHLTKAKNKVYKDFIIDMVKKDFDKKIMSKKEKPLTKMGILNKWIIDNYLYPNGYDIAKKPDSTPTYDTNDPLAGLGDEQPEVKKPKKKTSIDTFVKKGNPNISVKELTKLVYKKLFENRNETLNKIKQVRQVIEIQQAKKGDTETTPSQAKEFNKRRPDQKIKSGLQNFAYKMLRWNDLSNPMSSKKQIQIAKTMQKSANEFLYKRGMYVEISAKGQLSTTAYLVNGDRYWKHRRYLRNSSKVMKDLQTYINRDKNVRAAKRIIENKRPTRVASR